MTLKQKYEQLTAEQREKFAAVKTAEQLEAFLAETGAELTAEEKQQVLAYADTGAMPLDDGDLDAVAGGQPSKFSPCSKCGTPTVAGMPCDNCMKPSFGGHY